MRSTVTSYKQKGLFIMKKIGIVVVTYNRLECLKQNIAALKALKAPEDTQLSFYIIDNASTDGTPEWLKENVPEGAKVVEMPENLGGSGGFSTGVETAYEDDMDFIWGMDDDAYPEPDALVAIFDLMKIKGEECCYWSNCNKDDYFKKGFRRVKQWMFVGFFVPRTVIDVIGFPRSDFFIFFDDAEYSDRIVDAGYRIYKVEKSVINHKDSYSDKKVGKFLGKDFDFPSYPDWKMYYYVRNFILRYKKSDRRYWERVLIKTPKLLVKLLLLSRSQVKIAAKAYWHGIIGKSGKQVSP